MTTMTGTDCAVMCNLINTHTDTRERQWGWKPGDEHRMGTGTGAGTETRPVAETGTGTRTGLGRAEEGRRSAKNYTKNVNAIRYFYSARVIISTDRG